jgi:malonyl-CoA/methylmalonyl-CoA synthetase
MSNIPLITRAEQHGERTAILSEGESFTYAALLADSAKVAAALLDGAKDLNEARVAFLFPSGYDYVRTQWGIWRAGGIAVPLCTTHPRPELEYVLADAEVSAVIAHAEYAEFLIPIAEEMGIRVVTTEAIEQADSDRALPEVGGARRAMILYTSGTTGKPKGVVTTHTNIEAQIATLVDAWGWQADDHILQMLPLHHIHGIINVCGCALWSGAVCDMIPRFDAESVWKRFVETDLTLFMAVPTIYAKLAAAWEAASPETQREWSEACKKFRLMVSGSAALPVPMLERWETISGHRLLERYGMTEIGMALSNPLKGERLAGHVGAPLPGVRVRLIDEDGNGVVEGADGEIQIKGPSVFNEYWKRPEVTEESFVDGWFKSGDIAIAKNDIYRILGRNSVDIIKTGGYKVSALEIEEVLRNHEAIAECAVVGMPDEEWGEVVSAALVLKDNAALESAALRGWCKERLAPYKSPTKFLYLDALPRNAMGKVTKPDISALFAADGEAS